MPMTNMMRPPGTHIPAMAAAAPWVPRRWAPGRPAMFVECRPGRVWLIATICTNVSSSTQRRFSIRPCRKYAITPPPKLVAPITRNARKISASDTLSGDAGSPVTRRVPRGVASFVGLGRDALEAIDDAGLGRAERNPVVPEGLQRGEKFLDAPLDLGMEIVAAVELGLERVLSDERLVLAAR